MRTIVQHTFTVCRVYTFGGHVIALWGIYAFLVIWTTQSEAKIGQAGIFLLLDTQKSTFS